MSVSIDISGLHNSQFLFAPSALAELVAALHLLLEPGHHESQHRWIEATVENLDHGLLARLKTADYLWRTSRSDMMLPAAPSTSLAQELDALDQLSDEVRVNSALITSSCGVIPLRPELGSPLLDAEAASLARERAGKRGPRELAFVDSVLADPSAARIEVRQLLEDSYSAFFEQAWHRVVAALTAEARRTHDLLATYGLESALEAVSDAVVLDTQRHRIVVDKLQDRGTTAAGQGITFLPSAFAHPHVLVVHAAGLRPVIQYPVQDLTPSGSTRIDEIESRIHALDNPIRLRLLRSILRASQTTQELAQVWGLSAPEVSRHLAVLKEAGLVSTVREGRFVRYTFDHLAIARLGTDVIEALQR